MLKTPLDDWIARKIGVPAGTLTREAVEAYQLAQLQKTIALVKCKSAFYDTKLARVEPDRITSLARFAELPFTSPQDIRDDPYGFVCSAQGEIERIVSLQSSGTTGKPKRIFFTKEDQELTIDFFDYGMRNLAGPSDRILILLPFELPGSVGDLLQIALTRMGAYPVLYGPVYDAADAIMTALERKTNVMVGIPTHVLSMARHKNGGMLKGTVKSVLLTTDNVPGSISRAVEKLWDCKVFNHYGMTEMGLGGGVQCEARSGYHIREADLYFEIINPENGQILPEGDLGEVVFTTLTRNGMPLVRYRTGDLSRFVPGYCPCGSTLRQMDIIRGRLAERKVFAGKTISISELDEAIFQIDGVLDYRCGLSLNEGKEIIKVDVLSGVSKLLDKDALGREVQSVLHRIPAVLTGLASGQAQVVVTIVDTRFPVSRGTIKRTIIDLRSEVQL